MPASKSSLKQSFYVKLNVRNKTSFKKFLCFAKISKIDKSVPSNKYLKLIKFLPAF